MKKGKVMTLGRHRLMCGDAGNSKHVAALMGDVRPDLVFTSPPYAQQRRYVSGIGDWDMLMQRVFGAMPHHEKTQVMVNLGLVHRGGEWVPYWDKWIEWMRAQGWRRFGWYVWDKLMGMPGQFNGRLAPCFEFLFHFNRQSVSVRKTLPCAQAGRRNPRGQNYNRPDGVNYETKKHAVTKRTSDYKLQDSVIRVRRNNPFIDGLIDHPAVFPVALPTDIIRAYTNQGDVVYEPFAGSGTTILAAEREGRTCYAMECEPSYCRIAVERFRKESPQHPLPGVA